MARKVTVFVLLIGSLLIPRAASAVSIPATDFDVWVLGAGALIDSSSDTFSTFAPPPPTIGDLDNELYFNAATGEFTYVHHVTPSTILNISEFSTGFEVEEFANIAGFSFSETLGAGGAGNASDFNIEFESDNSLDFETLFGGTDGWDSPETITFFFVSTRAPHPLLRDYNIINTEIGSAQSLAPAPEPGSMLLLGTGLAAVYGAVRRRRNLKP